MLRPASIALMVITLGSPAWAGATVQAVKPGVSINRGQGYQVVAAAVNATPGDQVMAGPSGQGRIVYPDGCAVDVYPGAVVTVPEKCYQPMRAGLEAPVAAATPIPWLPIVGAAAVIGVGACAVSGCFEDDDNPRPPRSP